MSLRLRIRHSGESVILKKVDDKRRYLAFRAALYDDPIEWWFTWNNGEPIKPDAQPETAIDTLLRGLLEKGKVEKVEEYKPSLFSDFQLMILDFAQARKANLKVKSINLNVTFSVRGTASPLAPPH